MSCPSLARRAALVCFAVVAFGCGQDELHFDAQRDASICRAQSESSDGSSELDLENLSAAQIRALADSIEMQLAESAGAREPGDGLAQDGQGSSDATIPAQSADSPNGSGTSPTEVAANED